MAGVVMRFDWDPGKAARNCAKHRVAFEEACSIFADAAVLSLPDPEHSAREERWVSLGLSSAGRVLVVVHTWPRIDDLGQELVRIISSRRANAGERQVYLERKP